MKYLSPTSLRVQAILWTLLPLTLIFVIIAAVGLFAYGEVVSRLVLDRDRELARLSAERLSDNMNNYAGILRALATHEQMTSGDFDEQRNIYLTAHRDGHLRHFDGGVTFFNRKGEPLLSGESTLHAMENGTPVYQMYPHEFGYYTVRDQAFFQIPRETKQPYFSDVTTKGPVNRSGNKQQLVVSVPILNDDDRFIGLLAGTFLLDEETLGQEVARLGVGTAYLVDRKGRAIWHAEDDLIGKDLSDETAVDRLLTPESATDAFKEVEDSGEMLVVGYAPVQSPDWGLVIEESWDAVIGPVRTFQWILLGTLMIGLALVMVMISSGTRRLTEPINELVNQTQQLSQGDYVGHVEGGSIDEMRALARAFNEMADRVARYRSGLQSYIGAITHTQEEERKRIARELHDDTIQTLIALGRRMELMERSLEDPIAAAKQLYQLQQLLADTIAEVRQFSRDLRPLLLEDLGLEAAVRQTLREIERREALGATFTRQGEPPEGGLDDELEVALYRIAQEAISNVCKHAQATRLQVTLAYKEQEVCLTIRDDGRGFSPAEASDLAQQGSFGLMGIRERAKLFGGRFHTESTPGEGTCVAVNLPHTVSPDTMLTALQEEPLSIISHS